MSLITENYYKLKGWTLRFSSAETAVKFMRNYCFCGRTCINRLASSRKSRKVRYGSKYICMYSPIEIARMHASYYCYSATRWKESQSGTEPIEDPPIGTQTDTVVWNDCVRAVSMNCVCNDSEARN